MRRCTKCILPEAYPGIFFDDNGVCNFCHAHRDKRVRGEAALRKAVEPYRGTGHRYDCIVALSGGRDSSYAAYYAAKVLGLRALLFTFDNGFLPEQTRENCKNAAKTLGKDHVITGNDRVRRSAGYLLRCWVQKPSPAMIGLLCSGCMSGIRGGLAQVARKHQITLVVSGSGEPKGRSSFAQTLLSPEGRAGKKAVVSGFVREVFNNPRYALNPGFVCGLARDYFYRFYQKLWRKTRSMSVFGFVEWNEKELLSTIQNELGWKKPAYSSSTWRADCMINELKNYLYLQTLGFTKHDEQLSTMIRIGMMTREQALRRVASENCISREFMGALCADLKTNLQTVDRAIEKAREHGQLVARRNDENT